VVVGLGANAPTPSVGQAPAERAASDAQRDEALSMSRYTNTLGTSKPPELLNQQIAAHLKQQGFQQVDPVKNVWQKGIGFLVWPQFVRFETRPGALALEAWIKFALLPGVFVGEMGIDGVFGLIPKRMLKARVVEIEKLA
jgi:hypothetical protein